MAKMFADGVKYIDKMQEALEELKKPKFKNLGEYGKYIKGLKNPTRDQKAMIVYSILDMIESQKEQWGAMTNEKLVSIIKPIGDEVGIQLQEMLQLLMQLLSDPTYFAKIGKEFRALFESMRH